jgi:hypothetical protein
VSPEEQQLLLTPFFFDWITHAKRADLRSPAEALREFLRVHGGIDDDVLPKASEAAYRAYARHRSRTFELRPFGSIAGEPVLASLIKAGVLVSDRGGEGHFFHQLQHDYLASHHLATHEALWTDEAFDAVSFGARTGAGVSVLTLVVEQLGDPVAGDRFIRRVYDWNWLSAIQCTAEAAAATPKRCTEEMEAAIVALVSEKLFDPVPNTRRKAQNSVRRFRSPSALKLISSESLADLIKRLGDIGSERPWFAQWRMLFQIKDPGTDVANLITSDDPVIGWTASNVLRRAPVREETRDLLGAVLEAHHAATAHDRVVRWRIVHALGRSSGTRAVDTLVASMVDDDYLWVRYGAARSLVEVAVNSADPAIREAALSRMTGAAASLPDNVRHEAGEALAHDSPPAGWAKLVLPFMKAALDASTDDMDRKRWEERIARLCSE